MPGAQSGNSRHAPGDGIRRAKMDVLSWQGLRPSIANSVERLYTAFKERSTYICVPQRLVLCGAHLV